MTHKDITDILKEAINKDKVDLPIHTALATVLKDLWTQKTGSTKKIKDKIENISRPNNCEFFITQKVNEELYTRLKTETAMADKRMQKSQKFLTTAAISVANILNLLMKTNTNNADTPENTKAKLRDAVGTMKKIKKEATDAFSMLSYMKAGMVQHRKDKIRLTRTPMHSSNPQKGVLEQGFLRRGYKTE